MPCPPNDPPALLALIAPIADRVAFNETTINLLRASLEKTATNRNPLSPIKTALAANPRSIPPKGELLRIVMMVAQETAPIEERVLITPLGHREATDFATKLTSPTAKDPIAGAKDPIGTELTAAAKDPTAKDPIAGAKDLIGTEPKVKAKDPTAKDPIAGVKDPTAKELTAGVKDPIGKDLIAGVKGRFKDNLTADRRNGQTAVLKSPIAIGKTVQTRDRINLSGKETAAEPTSPTGSDRPIGEARSNRIFDQTAIFAMAHEKIIKTVLNLLVAKVSLFRQCLQ